MITNFSSDNGRKLLLAVTLTAAAASTQAAPVTVKYVFDNSTSTSYANPGLDTSLAINPALINFSDWSDGDGTLIQSTPIAATDGLLGQNGVGRAVAARGWHDGNTFNFSFEVAAGSRLDITRIDFW